MNSNTADGSAETPPKTPPGSANKAPRKAGGRTQASGAETATTAPDAGGRAAGATLTPEDLRSAVFDFGEHVIAALARVQAEQQQLWAQDVLITREVLQQQRDSHDADRVIFAELSRQRSEGARTPRISDSDEQQLRVALQFRALRTTLGSRDRDPGGTLPALITPPRIVDTRVKGAARFVVQFFADFPQNVTSVRLLRSQPDTTTEHSLDEIQNGQLAIDTDNVSAVELVGAAGQPLAMGIPFRG